MLVGRRLSGGLIVGTAILFVGVMLTLDNLQLLEAESRAPLLAGRAHGRGRPAHAGPRCGPGVGSGFFLIVAGGLLLLVSLDFIEADATDLIFPLLFIFIGGHLVARGIFRSRAGAGTDPADRLRTVAVMAGIERKHASVDFRGGDAAAVMGGCEIDLRDAKMPSGNAVVDVFAFWGGVELRVPPEWRVTGEVFPLMGAFEDNTKPPAEPQGHLVVRGLVVMGGVEVSN